MPPKRASSTKRDRDADVGADGAFPKITGTVVYRPDKMTPEWQAHVYGYAASNFQNIMNPALIAYAETVEDVQATVKYATENNVAVAVRSGSHHYLGACSTTGKNIQLDLSSLLAEKPEQTPWKYLNIDAKSGLVTMGCGVSLGILATELDKAGLWVPFGECSSVFAGGHSQSGGSSPCMWTIGGYLVDHIQQYDLVTANGELKSVFRDVSKNKCKQDSELFWAIAGASPGNFGVVTRIVVQCDFNSNWEPVMEFSNTTNPKTGSNYQNLGRYTKARLERMMTLFARCNDELALPEDQRILPNGAKFAISQAAAGPFGSDKKATFDDTDWAVKHFQNGEFFDRAHVENKAIGQTAMNQIPFAPFPLMMCACLVFVKKDWSDEYKAKIRAQALAFFAILNDTLDWGLISQGMNEGISVIGHFKNDLENICRHFLPKSSHDHKEYKAKGPEVTMSGASLANTHFIEKEHLTKWQKINTYGGFNSNTNKPFLYDAKTKSSAWAKFVADEYEKIEGLPGVTNTLKADISLILGGPGGAAPKDGRNFAAFRSMPVQPSWMEWTMWWGPSEEEGKFANAWADNMTNHMINDKTGLWATKTMCNLGLPFDAVRTMDTPEHRYWSWEDEATYNRVLAVKKYADPTWTFTANTFGIGASDPAAQKHVKGE